MAHSFIEQLIAQESIIPVIRIGNKIHGKVLKYTQAGVLIDCEEGVFTGIILPKEVKDLEKNNFDLSVGQPVEAEILGSDIMTQEGYFVISITKLKQQDAMKVILKQMEGDEVITVIPTEANLGGLLVDMYGVKGFIPLSQLSPIHYPRVEDGDQEKIFAQLLQLLGQEFKVRIMNFDDGGRRMVLSEKEAMREERAKIFAEMKIGSQYDGVVSGLSSYGFFVTIGGGVEGLVHLSEITYGHVSAIDTMIRVGDPMKVQVIGNDDGKISLSAKALKKDPWSLIPEMYKQGDIIEGEVVRYVPYGVFIRVYEDINGLVHLSEINSKDGNLQLKIGQIVKAKIILLEPHNRKIGLSIRALNSDGSENVDYVEKKPWKPKPRREDYQSRPPVNEEMKAGNNEALGNQMNEEMMKGKHEIVLDQIIKEITPKKAKSKKEGDDLKKITGIGPAFEKRLNLLGITSFPDLVGLSDKKIMELEQQDNITSIESRHNWIAEAKSLLE